MSAVEAKIKIPGFEIAETIYCGSRTIVLRGTRISLRLGVVLKLMRKENPSFNEIVQFRNQYAIAKNLDIAGVVKPLSLEPYQNGYVLVMEDFGGISLKDYASSYPSAALPLTEFLAIAIQIVSILDLVHRACVIHKDIKPANILINTKTKQVKLIDFSIASLLSKETPTPVSPNILSGTLPYISPEQTGRMNCPVDYRSDLYSLGVTFYELLTGQRPFISNDAIELVHCHIAKHPTPARIINPDIPETLDQIVQKLMAKAPSERYQSLLGLNYDLELCLHEIKNIGIDRNIELGTKDIPEVFIIPDRLYGRGKEVEKILAAFDSVIETGEDISAAGIVLVAGFSGIGKTTVINEVHKPIIENRGYFIKGKFDQFQRNDGSWYRPRN